MSNVLKISIYKGPDIAVQEAETHSTLELCSIFFENFDTGELFINDLEITFYTDAKDEWRVLDSEACVVGEGKTRLKALEDYLKKKYERINKSDDIGGLVRMFDTTSHILNILDKKNLALIEMVAGRMLVSKDDLREFNRLTDKNFNVKQFNMLHSFARNMLDEL